MFPLAMRAMDWYGHARTIRVKSKYPRCVAVFVLWVEFLQDGHRYVHFHFRRLYRLANGLVILCRLLRDDFFYADRRRTEIVKGGTLLAVRVTGGGRRRCGGDTSTRVYGQVGG